METIFTDILTPAAQWFSESFPELFGVIAIIIGIFWLGRKVEQFYSRFTRVEETCSDLSIRFTKLESYMHNKFDEVEKGIRSLTEAVLKNTTVMQETLNVLRSESKKS